MEENEEREEPSFSTGSKRERLQRDLLWGKEHENDSDEELLAYLRNAAETLGRVPAMKDVIGGHYIARRFCSWGVAVKMSGLSLKTVKKPGKQALKDYKRRRSKRTAHDKNKRDQSRSIGFMHKKEEENEDVSSRDP